jgi:hypothetical protein
MRLLVRNNERPPARKYTALSGADAGRRKLRGRHLP